MPITADLLRGYTDTIIMHQLEAGDSYGYQINKQISDISDGRLEMKEATLYNAFRRMESAGYITSHWGNEEQGARRRYYSLTTAGREKLQEDINLWHSTRELLTRLMEGNEHE